MLESVQADEAVFELTEVLEGGEDALFSGDDGLHGDPGDPFGHSELDLIPNELDMLPGAATGNEGTATTVGMSASSSSSGTTGSSSAVTMQSTASSSSDKGGSGEPPAPPPPPPPPPPPIAHMPASSFVVLDCGCRITHYIFKDAYEVRCGNRDHGYRCRLTRSSKSAEGQRLLLKPGQGRPMGRLLEWASHCAACGTQNEHHLMGTTPDTRVELRNAFTDRARNDPMAQSLLDLERAKRAGETSEPEEMD